MLKNIITTDNSKTTILIQLIIGAVFLSEGLQKLLVPFLRGTGRFEKRGLPFSEFMGTFVGIIEILCGTFILLGFFTRLVTPLLAIMLVAIATTKRSVFVDKGIWKVLHGSRTDWVMLMESVFLLINGAGHWSIDKRLKRNGTN